LCIIFVTGARRSWRSFQRDDFSVRTDPEGKIFMYVCMTKQREEIKHRGDDLTDNQTN
jgi:hypothetical protein